MGRTSIVKQKSARRGRNNQLWASQHKFLEYTWTADCRFLCSSSSLQTWGLLSPPPRSFGEWGTTSFWATGYVSKAQLQYRWSNIKQHSQFYPVTHTSPNDNRIMKTGLWFNHLSVTLIPPQIENVYSLPSCMVNVPQTALLFISLALFFLSFPFRSFSTSVTYLSVGTTTLTTALDIICREKQQTQVKYHVTEKSLGEQDNRLIEREWEWRGASGHNDNISTGTNGTIACFHPPIHSHDVRARWLSG